MKNFVTFIFVLSLILTLSTCATGGSTTGGSSQRVAPSGFPAFVRDAYANQPDDVLMGVGSARLATISQSMTISANRARAEIARQMNNMADEMIRDFQASNEVDSRAAVSFQENINVTLTRADISGARIVAQDMTEDQTVWTVVYLDRASVVREISQAQAAARLAVPAMASFDAEARMNEAFTRQRNAEPQARSFD
ncbi:MAG: hypothetical protein LBC80_06880 [Treponema sp.]|jgi:hypothetical protein|nr:hypothetical protein [Treponema sp.]